ncbi:MAG: hypothetical protein HYT37_01380 [Candidatus Sungbacteria bacterium]|nr:hypothetical protein [Candidatus Sungbacteria bacterium]
MRRIVFVSLFALLLSGIITGHFYRENAYRAEHYNRELIRAELQNLPKEEGKLLPRDIRDTTPGQLWLLNYFGTEAFLADKRYPEQTLTLYLLFGHTREFSDVLYQNGYQKVVPVVWYFFNQEKAHSYELRDLIAQGITGFMDKGVGEAREKIKAAWENPLTPDERAWIAINRILHTNGNYLGQFVIDAAGIAHRSQTSRFFGSMREVVAGDIESLEWKYRSGEEIAASDVLWAAADIAFLAAIGAKSLHILYKTGKLGATAGRAGKVSRMALFAPRMSARIVKYGTIGLGAYLLYKHPSAFNAGIGVIAEFFGLPYPLLWQYLVWILLAFIFLFSASWIAIPLIVLGIRMLVIMKLALLWLFNMPSA